MIHELKHSARKNIKDAFDRVEAGRLGWHEALVKASLHRMLLDRF
jgi:hypothetical protein